jgi:hypothetical protein
MDMIGLLGLPVVAIIALVAMRVTERYSEPGSNAPLAAFIGTFLVAGMLTTLYLAILFAQAGQELVKFAHAYATVVAGTPIP